MLIFELEEDVMVHIKSVNYILQEIVEEEEEEDGEADYDETSNTTYFENQTISYNNCTLNLVNTSWSSWVNISVCYNNTVEQSRNLTQHDSNYCGEISNETFTEYRYAECNDSADSDDDTVQEPPVQTSSSGGSSGGGGGGKSRCNPLWECGEWGECTFEGIRERECFDKNNCGTPDSRMIEIDKCITSDFDEEDGDGEEKEEEMQITPVLGSSKISGYFALDGISSPAIILFAASLALALLLLAKIYKMGISSASGKIMTPEKRRYAFKLLNQIGNKIKAIEKRIKNKQH
jgi:hypothetical protein